MASRRVLLIGGIALVLAVACPPWSYYGAPAPEPQISEKIPRQSGDDASDLIQAVRGIAIMGIFVVTAVGFIKCKPDAETARLKRVVLWTAIWCGLLALLVPSAIIIGRIVKAAFG